uniref:Peptidase A1 domain-containing protein n=1 Tax=Manihot esculenta TaxID=3983 RepID=A0A2C9VAK4_MANES
MFCYASNVLEAKTKPTKLITKLIHRNSIHSPFHNPHHSIEDKAKFIFENSLARFTNYKTDLAAGTDMGLLFLVRFYIGNPAISQLAVMDTASNLLWVQCSPNWYISRRSPIPLLDPLKSSTYASMPCKSEFCSYFPSSSCINEQCTYNISYVNAPPSTGNAATEQLLFESDENIVVVPQVIFGCSKVNKEYIDGGINGVFGLGPKKLSMARQLANKFSYCIGDFYDPNYNYNRLILGDEARLEGDTTPLEMSELHYYLNLQEISIGENTLDIDKKVFIRNITDKSKLSGVIIDSGSVATWLVNEAYYRFRNEVKRILGDSIVDTKECRWCLCYEGTMAQNLTNFPEVVYHFSEEAVLEVGFDGIFYQATASIFCMAVYPSSRLPDKPFQDATVIGVMAQQNHNVAYDLQEKKLYLESIDCQVYEG